MATTLALLHFSPLPRLYCRSASSPPSTICLRPSPAQRHSTALCIVCSTDRLVSALAYTLPFLDSLHYGHFFFARVSAAAAAVAPIFPLAAAYYSVPYAAFVAFFALYLGIVRNPAFSHYVRYNAMQAVVLDVLLALPALLQRVFGTPSTGIGFRVLEMGYHTVFVFSLACFVYSVINCIIGKTPYLPLVASCGINLNMK